MTRTADFLIVGAGIVGLTIALELKRRYPAASVLVLEKEDQPGRHSSGRNSGVLHSGIYYPPQSLKARVCGEGARELADYCQERGLPLVRIGKILTPKTPANCTFGGPKNNWLFIAATDSVHLLHTNANGARRP